MRILICKTSSLGDVIHTLPALSDAQRALPEAEFHWLVEENFAQIPALHPAVAEVIPIALRRWRRGVIKALHHGELRAFRDRLRTVPYDCIIDAQGLAKSALAIRLAKGERVGFDRDSAREPWVARTYQRRIAVPKGLHAIERVRRLFAGALGYASPQTAPDYGLPIHLADGAAKPYLLYLHGTTWETKFWPETFWAELIRRGERAGFEVRLPWGNRDEKLRARRLAAEAGGGLVLPALDLRGMAEQLAGAAGVVGVDSGLAHLAAALGVPGITLYGPTRTELTGAVGPHQRNLAAQYPCAPCLKRHCTFAGASAIRPPCFTTLPPAQVWEALVGEMGILAAKNAK